MAYTCDVCQKGMGASPEYQSPCNEPGRQKEPRHYCTECWTTEQNCADCGKPVEHLTAHNAAFVSRIVKGKAVHAHAVCALAEQQSAADKAARAAADEANLAESNFHIVQLGGAPRASIAEFYKPAPAARGGK